MRRHPYRVLATHPYGALTMTKNQDLLDVIKRATKEVARWPAWKRAIAKKLIYEHYKPTPRASNN